MVWRHAAKIIVAAGEAFGKALTRAVREELRATQQAAERHATASGASREDARQSADTSARLGISLEESMKILDVRPPLEAEEVQNKYDFLFQLNDKSKGGSFYLQSKIYRAKERIDEEMQQNEQKNDKAANEV